MTSDQESLFPAVPDRGAARRWDPPTSREAAESMTGEVLGRMQAEILHVLGRLGGRGILDDVVASTGRQKGTTSRRLRDLEEGGYIAKSDETRAGNSGRRQTVWVVIDHG